MPFRDRADAGRQLAVRLGEYARRSDVIVVAVRAGGVPIAHEVARQLMVPLEMMPLAVIPVPGRPGLAMGALAHGGVDVVDERMIATLGIPQSVVQQEIARARLSLDRGALTDSRVLTSARDRIAVVVDDGLTVAAVGETAVLSLRRLEAARIILAAPVGRKDVCNRLSALADAVVCLETPEPFISVGEQFEAFPAITEAEVQRTLGGGTPQGEPIDIILSRAQRLTGDAPDYDRLLDGIGDARIVLLGESTHGTHEFYRERALITRRLIQEKHFGAVAVEADWPDAYRVNHYVRGAGSDVEAVDALGGFRRFPTWMWRNADVLDFVGWLRARNDARPPAQRAGFYGLDLYSLHASMDAVLTYLAKIDPDAAERARHRYACFGRFSGEMQSYAYATGEGLTASCEREVVNQLLELQRRRAEYASRNGRIAPDEFFFAEQNARLVRNAEEYYRTMLRGRVESWNLRDRHMAESLRHLLGFLEKTTPHARVVVWAHNSHVGDARATQMGQEGELNLGQLVREHFGGAAILIGFTTSRGTVTAASDWDTAAQRKEVRMPLSGSYERLFHEADIPRLLLPLRTDPDLAAALATPRLERAIGVLYLPRTERASHYFRARLSAQFDYLLHFDQTRAVEPLERTSEWDAGELAETYPSGL